MNQSTLPAAAAPDPVMPSSVTRTGTATPAAVGSSYVLIVEHMEDGSTKERVLLVDKTKGKP